MPDAHLWESEAANWIAWARTPGHDVFPHFAPAFFDGIVPAARGRTLEIGCGEGRVARELAARGHDVAALDASPTLVRVARDTDAKSAYLTASATTLPFDAETFDTVVAYNSLQTMGEFEDMAKTVTEAGRVVKAGGHLCICVAHPISDFSLVNTGGASGERARGDSYFERRRVDDTVTRSGLTMTFHGWTYTLEDYVRALERAGFAIERIREPIPTVDAAAERSDLARWRRIPLFLFIQAVRRPG